MRDLAGRTVVLTGASSGIGLEAAKALARRGARLVLVTRDRVKGAATVDAVTEAAGPGEVASLGCDFASLDEVRRLAGEILAACPRIDALALNAGAVSPNRQLTAEGYEQTFVVNHLSSFLLVHLLLDRLKASAPSRVVITSSAAHGRGHLDFDDLHYQRRSYSTLKAYARSKLANVLFAAELGRRLAGTGVSAFSLHPGVISTGLWLRGPWYSRPAAALLRLFMESPERGGAVIAHVAFQPGLESLSGGYFDRTTPRRPMRAGRDDDAARRLWEVSERLTGVAPGMR